MNEYIVRKGEWYVRSHQINPTDEEVLAFSKSLSESCPAVIQIIRWDPRNSNTEIRYETLTEFEFDGDDPLYMRFKIASISGYLPITLPE